MSYQVLALKYRPQTFDDVVGQDHVTTTLTNAISANRMAHALLFTGPRGTGKTTIARILAKALTCIEGPIPVPCNRCKLCRDITQGHCQDVFEIDGASNNSVDQIRELRENVTYMPSSARVKIYIIDEVHMLSTAAFNALLKTLEEPPAHVSFIFATTEVHKIPATILSRCQRHDLSRVSVDLISAHLGSLCQKEGYSLSKESLDLIATEADGSIRDGLSLLDRVLSASPNSAIPHERVEESLGVLDRKVMSEISRAVFRRDGAALIDLVSRIDTSGQDLKKFYSDIILHFRNLNIIRLCGRESTALNLTAAEKTNLFQDVEKVSPAYLSLLLNQLLENENLVKHSNHTQTAVEMVLLKIIQINPGIQLDQIIAKLDNLARRIDRLGAVQPASAHSYARPESPAQTVSEAGSDGITQAPPIAPPQANPPQIQVAPMPMEGTRQPETQPLAMSPAPGAPENQKPHQGFGSPAPETAPTPALSGEPSSSWQEFLVKIQDSLPFIFALLSRGNAQLEPDKVLLSLEIRSEFEKMRLKSKNSELQALSRQYLGRPIVFQTSDETPKADPALETRKAAEKAKQEAAMHPLVQETRRIFDGEIIL